MKDPKGINTLNNKIINSFNNFNPDLIITGHADNISHDTYEFIKNKNKSLKIAQWFLDQYQNLVQILIKIKQTS